MYDIPLGRRDVRVLLKDELVLNLLFASFTAKPVEENFNRKSLTLNEMVTLSRAHFIRVSHCSSFSNEHYSFNDNYPQDPSMDPEFSRYLKTKFLHHQP